jgi:hypothetical protein
MNAQTVVLVLRHNTKVESDVDLAAKELHALTDVPITRLNSASEVADAVNGLSTVDEIEFADLTTVAFLLEEVPAEAVHRIVNRSSFIQELLVTADRQTLKELNESITVPTIIANEFGAEALVVPSLYYLIECESVYRPTGEVSDRIEGVGDLVLEPFTGNSSSESRRVRTAIKTTLSLTHDLHVYKAKFFPRMVRALLNIYAEDEDTVFDPFVGSGTALLESSLLGYDASGTDIDPISVRISDCKTRPFRDFAATGRDLDLLLSETENTKVASEKAPSREGFPEELREKIRRQDERNDTENESEVVDDATSLAQVIQHNDWETCLPEVLASDAVTKKVRYRFVGVGNGSYTINVLKQSIFDRLRSKANRCREIANTFDSIERRVSWTMGKTGATQGDANDASSWPVNGGNFLILTSPPYLPASSGREHYAKSRALSFHVLNEENNKLPGFDTEPDEQTHKNAKQLEDFPESNALLDYLQQNAGEGDPNRDAMRYERKFAPTVEYLNEMRDFFSASAEQLASGGKLLLVVAYQHIFYSNGEDREVEHVVDCTNLYSELAESKGFRIVDEVKMQLQKAAGSNAKPRSKDDYHEVALVLERE